MLHARIQKVLSEGVQLKFDVVLFCFLVDEWGERIRIELKPGHHHLDGVSLAGRYFHTLNAGLVAL